LTATELRIRYLTFFINKIRQFKLMPSNTFYDKPNLALYDTQFWGINSQGQPCAVDNKKACVWIASSFFDATLSSASYNHLSKPSEKTTLHTLQKQAVRQLFHKLLNQLPIANECFNNKIDRQTTATCNLDIIYNRGAIPPQTALNIKLSLDESRYPYRLQPLGHTVSFSHSQNTVACALSTVGAIGIDIEQNPIPTKIGQRFFSHDEQNWLQQLPITEQQQALNLLWMLKEAHGKYQVAASATTANLMHALGVDLLLPAQALIDMARQPNALSLASVHHASNNSIESSRQYLYHPRHAWAVVYDMGSAS